MVNCNPETVSTDYDTSDRLYFEPLTVEDVLEVVAVEQPEGVDRPVRRPDAPTDRAKARAGRRERCSGPRSTPSTSRRTAGRFGQMLAELGIQHPPYGLAHSPEESLATARRVGFPLLVRPSYVLGGRAMEICYSEADVEAYLERLGADGKGEVREEMYPLLLDRFLENAIEFDVDALADGRSPMSRGSCSTSRRPASTQATRPASCRRSRSATTCWSRSAARPARSPCGWASSGS